MGDVPTDDPGVTNGLVPGNWLPHNKESTAKSERRRLPEARQPMRSVVAHSLENLCALALYPVNWNITDSIDYLLSEGAVTLLLLLLCRYTVAVVDIVLCNGCVILRGIGRCGVGRADCPRPPQLDW